MIAIEWKKVPGKGNENTNMFYKLKKGRKHKNDVKIRWQRVKILSAVLVPIAGVKFLITCKEIH